MCGTYKYMIRECTKRKSAHMHKISRHHHQINPVAHSCTCRSQQTQAYRTMTTTTTMPHNPYRYYTAAHTLFPFEFRTHSVTSSLFRTYPRSFAMMMRCLVLSHLDKYVYTFVTLARRNTSSCKANPPHSSCRYI